MRRHRRLRNFHIAVPKTTKKGSIEQKLEPIGSNPLFTCRLPAVTSCSEPFSYVGLSELGGRNNVNYRRHT